MKKLQLSLPASFILISLAALAVTAAQLVLQPFTGVSIRQMVIDSRGLTLLLNLLPVWMFMLTLFFITNRVTVACAAPGVIFLLFSIIHRYKVAMRFDPFRPFDLWLGMEFLGIAKSIKPAVFIMAGVGLAVFAVIFTAAFKMVKNNKLNMAARLAGGGACAAVMFVLNITVYSSAAVNAALPHQGSEFNDTDMYQSKGFVYSFLYDLNTSRIKRPAYYHTFQTAIETAEREAAEKRAAARPESRKYPHIIMILSEAFSELAMNPALSFEGYTDPLQYYQQIKAESLSGYIVVPHSGGGTADTEFDILTGLNTRDFRGVPYAFTLVTRPFPGFTSALTGGGYAALGLHPGAAWFYNRQNVYPLLGFSAFLDDRTFNKQDTKGGYITDEQAVTRVIQEFAAHTETSPGVPFFLDSITIQNHGPYNGKYAMEGTNFNTGLPFTADETEALAHYFEGLADSDAALKKLTGYFETTREPVLLVYYGDHLPSFPPSIYQTLIPAEETENIGGELTRYHRLPFIVWANPAARDAGMVDFDRFVLPENRTISAHYLGAAVLGMLGLDESDPLMALLNQIRPVYPIVLEQAYVKTGHGLTKWLDAESDPDLALYKSWEYYRVMNN